MDSLATEKPESPTARVIDIVRGTTVDGPGLRTSVYFAGCRHRCHGCHNPQSWDFNAGTEMSLRQLMEIIREEDFDVTLTGGDPLYRPAFVGALIDAVAETGHSVWVYTGFTWEQIQASAELQSAIRKAEAVVEGPYVEALRDPDLLFRGSSNQRIIRLKGGKQGLI